MLDESLSDDFDDDDHGNESKKRKISHNEDDALSLPSSHIPQKTFRELIKPIVKIFAVSTEPNYSLPWQMKKQQRSTSSGFVIAERQIITNAHAVVESTSIMVRKHGDAKKYVAKVQAVGHDCDLALLTVKDDNFWIGMHPVEVGGIPNLQEAVTVVGYPTGGDNISVTTGVVSRVDITTYSHASSKLLSIQIDAAINPGNSGGPAFQESKLVGIAFESLVDAENIGYVIPVPIIQHFMKDIEKHGKYVGFCDLGIHSQSLENEQLKRYLRMSSLQTGILVNQVEPLSKAAKVLFPNDVVLASDGVIIADDGTVPFRDGERICYKYLFMNKFVNDVCKLTIWRNGEQLEVEVTVSIIEHLVPIHLYDQLPSYYIFAGLVFVPLSRPYLRHMWGKGWDKKAPLKLCDYAMNGRKKEPDEEIVVLSEVLAAEINTGYQNIAHIQVISVNGVPVKNLKHLVELVEASPTEYVIFLLEFQK